MKTLAFGLAIFASATFTPFVVTHPIVPAPVVPSRMVATVFQAHACTYTVRSGDTLSGIAPRYELAWPTLYDLNRQTVGDNPDMIHIGDMLTICDDGHHTVSTPAPRPAAPRPTTPPAPRPISPPATGTVQGMIEQVFGGYAGGALAIARCESGYAPNAWNGIAIGNSHASGVFQILYPSTWEGTSYRNYSPYNAWANIQAAHEIFVRDGYSWREWECQP